MKELYDNVYLASFGRKVIKLRFDLFDASLVRRLAQPTILTYFSSTQIRVLFVSWIVKRFDSV